MNETKLKWAKLTLTTPRTDLESNSTIFITGADFKIGRAPTNDFVLSDPRLSSLHARITYEFDDQSQMIVKLWDNSTNGTFHKRKEVINSDRITCFRSVKAVFAHLATAMKYTFC